MLITSSKWQSVRSFFQADVKYVMQMPKAIKPFNNVFNVLKTSTMSTLKDFHQGNQSTEDLYSVLQVLNST